MMEKVFIHIRNDELIKLCFEELNDDELDREEWITSRMFHWEIDAFIRKWVGDEEE